MAGLHVICKESFKLIFLAMQYVKFSILFFLISFSLNHFAAGADDGYKITVKVNNLKDSVCYLGFYYGDKKYVQDTARINPAGQYIFEGNEPWRAAFISCMHQKTFIWNL